MKMLKNLYTATNGKKALGTVALMSVTGIAMATSTDSGSWDASLGVALGNIVDLINGPLGKIVILLALVWGVFQVVQTNWLQVFGAFLSAIVLVNAEEIVDQLFSAGVSTIQSVAPVVQNLPL
jgi:type IV secretory pathway VirB2 component (pilin)